MTKVHEETWVATPVLTKREPRWGIMVEPDHVVMGLCAETYAMQKHVDVAAQKMPARAALAAQAPAMARLLLALVLQEDHANTEEDFVVAISSLATEAKVVLRAAGVLT